MGQGQLRQVRRNNIQNKQRKLLAENRLSFADAGGADFRQFERRLPELSKQTASPSYFPEFVLEQPDDFLVYRPFAFGPALDLVEHQLPVGAHDRRVYAASKLYPTGPALLGELSDCWYLYGRRF